MSTTAWQTPPLLYTLVVHQPWPRPAINLTRFSRLSQYTARPINAGSFLDQPCLHNMCTWQPFRRRAGPTWLLRCERERRMALIQPHLGLLLQLLLPLRPAPPPPGEGCSGWPAGAAALKGPSPAPLPLALPRPAMPAKSHEIVAQRRGARSRAGGPAGAGLRSPSRAVPSGTRSSASMFGSAKDPGSPVSPLKCCISFHKGCG